MPTLTGIQTPMILQIEIPSTVDAPSFTARAMLDKEAGQYYANSVSMEHFNVAITSSRLSKLPVQKRMAPEIRRQLVEANVELLEEHSLLKRWAAGKPQRPLARKSVEAPGDDVLLAAAYVYTFAKLSGEAPVKAIARAAGMGHEDAKGWMKTIRKRDLL